MLLFVSRVSLRWKTWTVHNELYTVGVLPVVCSIMLIHMFLLPSIRATVYWTLLSFLHPCYWTSRDGFTGSSLQLLHSAMRHICYDRKVDIILYLRWSTSRYLTGKHCYWTCVFFFDLAWLHFSICVCFKSQDPSKTHLSVFRASHTKIWQTCSLNIHTSFHVSLGKSCCYETMWRQFKCAVVFYSWSHLRLLEWIFKKTKQKTTVQIEYPTIRDSLNGQKTNLHSTKRRFKVNCVVYHGSQLAGNLLMIVWLIVHKWGILTSNQLLAALLIGKKQTGDKYVVNISMGVHDSGCWATKICS